MVSPLCLKTLNDNFEKVAKLSQSLEEEKMALGLNAHLSNTYGYLATSQIN